MLIGNFKLHLTKPTAARRSKCQRLNHVSTTMHHALPNPHPSAPLITPRPHDFHSARTSSRITASPVPFSPPTTLHLPARFSLCMHVSLPTSSPDWSDPSPCVPFRPNISQRRTKGQELMVQRLSGVPACVLAGYSGVLSAIPFVESRDEEEARDRKVVRVAACNYQRIFTLA